MMKKIPSWLPGVLVSILLIAVLLYFVDLGAMVDAIREANYPILAAGFVLSIVWMFGRAKVWHTLLRGRASYRDTLFTDAEGYLLNAFLPFRLGELGRAILITRRSNLQLGEVLPTIVIERVVDLGISALIFIAALPLMIGSNISQNTGYLTAAAVVVGLLALYFLAHYNRWALDLFHKLSVRWSSLQKLGGGFLESFFEGLGVLKDGWLFIRFLFWMALNWGVALVAYYLMMLAFFPQAQSNWTLLLLAAAAFGGALPAAPGGLGTTDGAITWALTLMTGDGSTALALALTVRLYNYLNSGVIGGIGLGREGETLGAIYRELKNLRSPAGTDTTTKEQP
jgi:glycosyltransferase 2 family protein